MEKRKKKKRMEREGMEKRKKKRKELGQRSPHKGQFVMSWMSLDVLTSHVVTIETGILTVTCPLILGALDGGS